MLSVSGQICIGLKMSSPWRAAMVRVGLQGQGQEPGSPHVCPGELNPGRQAWRPRAPCPGLWQWLCGGSVRTSFPFPAIETPLLRTDEPRVAVLS